MKKINKLDVQKKIKNMTLSVFCRVYCLWVPGTVSGCAWWDPVDIQPLSWSRTLKENRDFE